MAHALSVEDFRLVTEPDQFDPTLDRTIEVVQDGYPAVIDVIAQQR